MIDFKTLKALQDQANFLKNIDTSYLRDISNFQQNILNDSSITNTIETLSKLENEIYLDTQFLNNFSKSHNLYLDSLTISQKKSMQDIILLVESFKNIDLTFYKKALESLDTQQNFIKEFLKLEPIFQTIPTNQMVEMARVFKQSLFELDSDEYNSLDFSIDSESFEESEIKDIVDDFKDVIKSKTEKTSIKLTKKQALRLIGFLFYFITIFHQEEINRVKEKVDSTIKGFRENTYAKIYLGYVNLILDSVLGTKVENPQFELKEFDDEDLQLKLKVFFEDEN